MSEPDEKTDTSVDTNVALWATIALMYGYNELAKLSTTLGEKVYCRLMRDKAEQEYKRLGGDGAIERDGDNVVLILGQRMPYLRFTDSDIELMRAAVARHDEDKQQKADA